MELIDFFRNYFSTVLLILFVFKYLSIVLLKHMLNNSIQDLHVDRPLIIIVSHYNSIDLNSLTDEKYLHLSSFVIIFKTLQILMIVLNEQWVHDLNKKKRA